MPWIGDRTRNFGAWRRRPNQLSYPDKPKNILNITSGGNIVTLAVISLLLPKPWKFWKWTRRPLDSLTAYSIWHSRVFSLPHWTAKAYSSLVPGTIYTGECKSYTANHTLSTMSTLARTWDLSGHLSPQPTPTESEFGSRMGTYLGISISNTYLPPFFYQTWLQSFTLDAAFSSHITQLLKTFPAIWGFHLGSQALLYWKLKKMLPFSFLYQYRFLLSWYVTPLNTETFYCTQVLIPPNHCT